MRQVADIAAAERQLGPVIEQALALFLSAAHARLLDGLPSRIVAAAATPDLANWPERERSWLALLERFVYAVLATIFSRRFRTEIREAQIRASVDSFVDTYIDAVWQQLKTFPEIIYDEVREEIAASVGSGESAQQTRDRVSDMLRINAPTRRLASQIQALERTIADPATSGPVRREARARLATLRRRDDRGAMRWWPKAAELARTLAVSALNAATASATDAYTQATGERRWRQWWSTGDDRVRAAHRQAHGQTRPVGEKFLVGGFPMDYPGDPAAPPDLVTNCRCSLLSLSAEQGQREQRAYQARARTTDTGRVVTAASDPRGGVSMDTAVTAEHEVVADQPPVLAAGKLPASATTARWRGVLAPMGVRSGDNRVIATPEGAPEHRSLPLPLLYQQATADLHRNSVVVGSITRIWSEDGQLMGEGLFDLGDETAREVVRKIDDGFHRWVSISMDKQTHRREYYRGEQKLEMAEVVLAEDDDDIQTVHVFSDWRVMSVTLVAEPAFHDAYIGLLDDVDEDDEEEPEVAVVTADATETEDAVAEPEQLEQVPGEAEFALPPWLEKKKAESSGEAMPGGRYPIKDEKSLRDAIRAVGRAGGKDGTEKDRNAVRKHIIARAKALKLDKLIPDTWNADGTLKPSKAASLMAAAGDKQAWYEAVAASVPMEPPSEWFADPQLTGPCKIRVTEEGRVYGHIAPWNEEHAALPGTPAPRSADGQYSKFHRHPVRCADGRRINTGPLAGSGHADEGERRLWAVQRHYDNPQYVIADVVVGEDEYGIWCSGALRYGVEPYQVMFADRYSFSGDWRGNELLAACLASVPGFHLDADDTVQALAASAGITEPMVVHSLAPQTVYEDGEAVVVLAAGVLPPAPERAASSARIEVSLNPPDPEEWGRRAGRGFVYGQEEAGQLLALRAEQERAQAALAAKAAEFTARMASREAARKADEVKALAARVLKVGA